MIAILTTHPIQYQVPLWQMLAREGSVPFEVWYLSDHATRESRDSEFGQTFSWDIGMLEGYRHRFLDTPVGATPNTPFRSRIIESLPELFRKTGTKVVWVQGWQVAAYWQAVWAAHRAGLQVWLRGESNAMAPTAVWKRIPKSIMLGQLFGRVDHFLCIGTANRALYRSYGTPEEKLHMAPYAVDNERFAKQAAALRDSKFEIRDSWRIPRGAFVVLFCGKFIPKKRPMDLVEAARLLITNNPASGVHLLFAGSGELGAEMRAACNVVFDAEALDTSCNTKQITNNLKPRASFAGFLNQTEISRAYTAANCLVLPSDYTETWGLVVNEAMASGLPCIISDRCGCAEDLGNNEPNLVFPCGDFTALMNCLLNTEGRRNSRQMATPWTQPPSLAQTVATVISLCSNSALAL